ncbi:MAG: PHP domain-containing protein [Candidatus Methanomethylophilus sp.]|nr:PHP domain-containing protein [Methanomethylophilus sp.]MBO5600766.1 PHP domain-containing protein [Methanomethylophilus sp.]
MEEMGKADTHTHTDYSGFNRLGPLRFPESVLSPEGQVDRARREGLSVLCVTDHNEVAGGFIAQKYAKQFDDIDVIVGDEVMTDQGEVIGLWLTEKPKKFLSPEETCDIIHEQGGLCIAPHPFSVHVDGMQEKIFELPLEGFETINGGHPDPYSNMFSKRIMDLYPGRWAEFSGSDAHSLYTAGYNWTEFPGNSEEDFRKAILHKKTVAKGVPAPVLGQVQWSMEVVWGGQKLMYKALRRKLEPVPNNALVEKILSNTDLKNATGIAMGFIYLFPLTSMLATLLSTAYLKNHAKKAMKHIDERIAKIQKLIAEIDARNGKAIAESAEEVKNDLEAGKIVLEQRL